MSEPIDLLLVEDNPGDVRIIQEVLKDDTEATFEIDVANSFIAAIAELEKKRYEVILLDLSLPDAHGLNIVRRAVELAPDAAILCLTGRSDENMAKEALRIGAQDYLLKLHIFGPDLAAAIHSAIERHAQKQ